MEGYDSPGGKLKSGVLTPAYGRDYKSAAAAKADLAAGKDFVFNSFNGSGLVSMTDLSGTFTVRYGKLRKVAVVKVVDGKVL